MRGLMNQTSETKRLADAVANIATTIAEIIETRLQTTGSGLEQRLQASGNMLEQKIARRTIQPIVKKKEAAAYFGVTVRSIDNWMKRGYLPYYKIGYCVRIPMHDAESWLREKCLVRR